ncbi:MAG: 4-hydroxythreonine-4-phosphate dehydrogenase PdxA [Rhodocyclaceae bacterium]|nr:MAG: 4-hydroxythreonine-4-phosphate dehydrogenase PdxA [Rhodocyclaceae bacterium]
MSSTSLTTSKPLVVTSGEPAGIGPEICLALAGAELSIPVVVLGDRDLIESRARLLGRSTQGLQIIHVPLRAPCTAGKLDPANAPYVMDLLDRALEGCLSGEFAGMVTAPVHKSVINDAGIPFTGHTEYLAEMTGTGKVVMMLAGGGLHVALVTTHLALKDVPAAITRSEVEDTVRIVHRDLKEKFGIEHPRILVAGLNPHAGEGGHMGRDEIEVIEPAIAVLRLEGIDAVGPLPADTLFTRKVLAGAHAQVAMYHDQGLAVLKYAAFEEGVNITLGLPILRTSVDHGTALDLAGSGKADPGSLFAAVKMAADIVARTSNRL